MSLDAEPLWQHGVHLFNQGGYFQSHEVLETLWTPSQGPRRLFLQAVIHFAVGLYHHQQENPAGAERQLAKGLRKLAGFLPRYEGVDTSSLYRDGIACLDTIRAGGTIGSFPWIRRCTAISP